MLRRSTTVLGLLAAIAGPAAAMDADYIGLVEVLGEAPGATASGRVFEDLDRDSTYEEGEPGIAGVTVSNGRETATTDGEGRWSLPAYEDMNVFVTKPAGYAVPVNAQMVPQFSYIHKVAGSPDLRFGGIAPTGPLPAEINFPMVADGSDRPGFHCLVFGDPQPYSNREVSWVRDTLGTMLANRGSRDTECLLFEGDIMGDDLSLYPRFKEIVAQGRVPYYLVAGNHDLDFDAGSDRHSFDTFRREFGPEYYSFDIGDVHFVVFDNVRYPCNGVDDHAFCAPDEAATYNGVIHDRQVEWFRADLETVPRDKLIVVNAHIPFQTFTDNAAAKHQTDNFAEIASIIGDRPALGLSGHTHTTENLLEGESFAGWEENTGLAEAPFHQIVTGALSGAWWGGDLNDALVPRATQRLGSPRGYYRIDFDGPTYTETFETFHQHPDAQMHMGFNTPRFRDWAERLMAHAGRQRPGAVTPPVSINDLGDVNMLTAADLAEGTWLAVNVWNGSRDTEVSVAIDGGAPIGASRSQDGAGEDPRDGPGYADPVALAMQSTIGRAAFASTAEGAETDGYEQFRGEKRRGLPGPWSSLATRIQHLWRANLPADLAPGQHRAEVTVTDHHGRSFIRSLAFEVVEDLPVMEWNGWRDEES